MQYVRFKQIYFFKLTFLNFTFTLLIAWHKFYDHNRHEIPTTYYFNPNQGGLFRGSFCGGRARGQLPSLSGTSWEYARNLKFT